METVGTFTLDITAADGVPPPLIAGWDAVIVAMLTVDTTI